MATAGVYNATKQVVAFPFSGGIDTKSDPKQMAPSNLTALTNGIFSQKGLISRRWGYTSLSTGIVTGGSIAGGAGLAPFGNEIVAFDGSKAYSYISGESKWTARGTDVPCSIVDQTILANSYQQLSPDHARLGTIDVYAWEDSRLGVRVSVFDTASGLPVLIDTLVSTTSTRRPKCIAIPSLNQVAIFVDDGSGNLKVFGCSPTSPNGLTTIGTPITGLVSPFYYDVAISASGQVYVTYWKLNVDQTAIVVGLNAGLTAASWTVTYLTLGVVTPQLGGIGVTTDASNNAWVMAGGGSQAHVTIAVYNTAGTQQLAPTAGSSSLAGLVVTAMAGVVVGTVLSYFTSCTAAAGLFTSTKTATLTNTMTIGGVDTAGQSAFGLSLASKGFAYTPPGAASALILAWMASGTNQQASYFLVQFGTYQVIAKTLYGVGGGFIQNSDYMVPECQSLGNSTWTFANLIKGVPNTTGGVVLSLLGVSATTVSFASSVPIRTASINGSLYVSGGLTRRYDGQHFVEAGFLLYPEELNAGVVASGGSIGIGTYQYTSTYEWVDAQGNNEISTPSPPVTATVAVANSSCNVIAPNLNVTNKAGVKFVVYRTQNNGTVFYRVSSATSPVYNVAGGLIVTFTDTLADASIAANGALYTQPLSIGQNPVLFNYSPPKSTMLETYAQRLWIGGLDDPYTLWYSQTAILGSPMQFNPFLNLRVDPDGGPITAIKRMDGNLFIFKAFAVMYVTGQGPTATGDNSDLGTPILLPTGGIGCVGPAAIVLTPQGLLFQTTGGEIYQLDRSLNLTFIGAQVQSISTTLTITSATVIPDQWVVFTSSQGTALVYDYLFSQWGTFTNHAAVGACQFAGAAGDPYCWLDSSGVVHQQSLTAFTDSGSPIPFALTTSWINPTTLQGYQRVYHAFIVGQYISPHTLNMQAFFDYDSTDGPLQASIAVTAATGLPTYQYRLDLLRKCQAVQFTIQDNGSSLTGAGFSLSALSLVVGVKSGGNKLPASKQFGVI